MAAVEFEIKGLAACYRKEGNEFWNISFPTDDKHEVDFYWTKGTQKEEGPIKLAGKSVTFSSTDTEPPSAYEDHKFIKHTIDLTSDYLHSDGIKKRPVFTMGTEECRLQIPHAMLTSKKLRDKRLNYVFLIDEPDTIRLIKDKDNPSEPQIFSNLAGGVINIKAGGEITINIAGEEPIILTDGDSFRIDNDCNNESERNDFQLYQDIFENKIKADKQYEMISINNPKPAKKNNQTKAADSPKRIVTDPPPLICDTVRISQPNDLD